MTGILCKHHDHPDGHPFHGPACPLSPDPLSARIRTAIADPAQVLPRRFDRTGADGQGYEANTAWADYETVTAWSGRAVEAVIAALAAHHPRMLLGDTHSESVEYSVSWHAGEPGENPGILLAEYQISYLWQAIRAAEEKIGDYGITWFTIERRTHLGYEDGSSWTGPWQKVPASEVEVARRPVPDPEGSGITDEA